MEKELTIRGPADGRRPPTVDGRCRTGFTMLVFADPVRLKNFRVTGAADAASGSQYGGAEVNFASGGAGSASGLSLRDECGVQYGVNVFDTGDVLVADSRFRGYEDAGVYVGGIRNPRDAIEVTGNDAAQNNRGVMVEDSAGHGGIRVAGNVLGSNTNGFTASGVFLRNADGVEIAENVANDNAFAGIHLDGTSDQNRVLANSAAGNGTDLINEGQGNCGTGNTFGNTAGSPLASC